MNEFLEKKFSEKPYLYRMGSKKIAEYLKVSVEDVVTFRKNNKKTITPDHNEYKSTGAKILIFDLETSPLKAYIWKLWKENIYLNRVISD